LAKKFCEKQGKSKGQAPLHQHIPLNWKLQSEILS